ncbi:hypothetical protein [Enterocloster sp.]|uniref:hypothetical protein n=1 Tax=Enterocloster sp. TaxID=2719315 RepID=UPI0039A366D7
MGFSVVVEEIGRMANNHLLYEAIHELVDSEDSIEKMGKVDLIERAAPLLRLLSWRFPFACMGPGGHLGPVGGWKYWMYFIPRQSKRG